MTPFLDTLGVTRCQQNQSVVDQAIKKYTKRGPSAETRVRTYLQKKAWAKYKTVESILELINLKSPFEKRYWDTFHCCETILMEGQYITGSYCGNRWCRVCGRIVTAKLIQAYKPILAQFQDPQFVTLTIVNPTETELIASIKKMVNDFVKINYNFRTQRPYRVIGIRKIEVEPSEHPNEYHPHFHIIMEGKNEAEALIQEWLIYNPTADIRGQNITKCNEGSLTEFFKYTTKPVVKNASADGQRKNHTAYQLDVIYRSLDKKRIFQPIGIQKAHVKENIEGVISQKIPDLKFLPLSGAEVWTWNQQAKDWISIFGDRLSKYRYNKEIPGFVPTPGYNCRN